MAKEKETFEVALRRLEEAVSALESGELPLEESLACFERGVQCAARCSKLLQAVEARVELLLKDREGALTVEPFERP